MHLSSLTLTNIRQFDQRTFEFKPGFNLLVGENGSGKTTILRGLMAALGDSQQVKRRPKLADEDIQLHAHHAEVKALVQSLDGRITEFHLHKKIWDRVQRTPRQIERPLVLLYASNEAICSALKSRQAKHIHSSERDNFRRDEEFLYRAEIRSSNEPDGSNQPQFGNSSSVRDFVGKILSTFATDFRNFYWRFEPYDCSILIPHRDGTKLPLDAESEKRARAFAMRYFQEGWYRRRRGRLEWPNQSKVILNPDSSARLQSERTLPDIAEIWGPMKFSPEVREILLTCSLEVKLTPRIMIRRKIGLLSLSQLSDGEQRLFSLFVDIARQLSLQNSGDGIGSGAAIVLIDEIDVHLHPKWQRKIVPALEDLFQKCQFIATTHSPFVIQATDRQKVTSIDPEFSIARFDTGNSIEDIAEEIQGVRIPQRGVRAEKLNETAKRYFTLIRQKELKTHTVTEDQINSAERNYREASEPFTSEPAVHAFLKVQLLESQNL